MHREKGLRLSELPEVSVDFHLVGVIIFILVEERSAPFSAPNFLVSRLRSALSVHLLYSAVARFMTF